MEIRFNRYLEKATLIVLMLLGYLITNRIFSVIRYKANIEGLLADLWLLGQGLEEKEEEME